MGPRISAGAREPAAARSAITVAGTSWTEAVLSAQSMACASLAVPGRGFSVSSSCMARMPNGVAAFPRPSTLAETFMTMAPMAGWPSGTSGKSRRSTGARQPGDPADQAGLLRDAHEPHPERQHAHQAEGERGRLPCGVERGGGELGQPPVHGRDHDGQRRQHRRGARPCRDSRTGRTWKASFW